MFFQVLISTLTMFCFIKGIRIQECTNGNVEAVENSTRSVTCVDYTGTVVWQYRALTTTSVPIGTCGSTCTVPSPPGFFTLTRLSASSSRLGLSSTVTAKQYIGYEFICESAKCVLTIIVNAVLGDMTVNLSNTGNGWTVSGTVPITKVFSSSKQYRCVWSRRHGNGQYTNVTTKMLFPETNPNHEDKSGTCDFTDSLPNTTGTYTYRVQVYPGATEKTDSSVVIASPPTPIINCTPSTQSGYVSEDTDVSCTCSGSVGRPAGRLVWVRRNNNVDTTVKEGGDGQTSLQLTMTVNRSHDGNELRCDVDWVTDTTGPAYIVNVAYGPTSASIPESSVFYTDSAGLHELTLTCQPNDVNPTTGLTYKWTGRCDDVTSDRCTFRPRPPDANGDGDDGVTMHCQVTNPFANKMAQISFILDLKYPPRVAPQIQGYTDNKILYQDDPLKINCSVAGGKPPVTSVTLTCTGYSQEPNIGQSSSLSVTSLDASDHAAVCTCRASWVKHEYYTLTATRTLTVYFPPSAPDLRQRDGMMQSYHEGDNVTLTCSVTSSGHPTANLTWSGHENGVITHPDQKTSILRLLSVGKGDHLRNITCHAVNDFTRHKQQNLSDVETLRVYYGPYITLNSSAGNTCTMTSDSMTCTTVEGQRIHFRSHADSYPPPQRYVWQSPDGSDLDPAIAGDLDIVSINRSQSGVYRVQVTTNNPDVDDDRLPLNSHYNLTVLVKYMASDVNLSMDKNTNLTINENDLVTFDCQSRGRPTPELNVTQSDTLLQRAEGGKLSLSEDTTRLTNAITAQCNNTGLYTCSAHNGVGDTQRDTAQLYVNCKPRSTSTESTLPKEVNYEDQPVCVEFGLVAFPVPDNLSFTFLNNGSDTNVTGNIKLNASCSTHDTEYEVSCKVTVSDATNKEAEGLYIFRAANAFGQENFEFIVTVNGTKTSSEEQTTSLDIAAVAGGIGAALVVIALVAVVVIFVRRRRKGTKQSSTTTNRMNDVYERDEPEMTVNELYGTTPGGVTNYGDDDVMIVNTAYASSAELTSKKQGNAYEDVELNSNTNASGACVSMPGSYGASASASARKDITTANAPVIDDGCNVYAVVNKGTEQPLSAPERPSAESVQKQRPDVKPKPAKKSKPGKAKDKPRGKKIAKHDEKQLLRTGEYSNVAMTSLTMSPHDQEGTVYENYAFEKEEGRQENQSDKGDSMNEDGLVYTTVAFSDKQLKKAEEPPPEREQTEYADIDFTRKAPYADANN